MRKEFIKKIMRHGGCIDTKKYRYWVSDDGIERLPLEYLGTIEASTKWELVFSWRGDRRRLRKIYMIEAISEDGELLMRRYAANMKTAKHIAKPYGELADIRLVSKRDWVWIGKNDVERL